MERVTKLTYTVNEAADALGISPRSVWRLIRDKKLRSVAINKRRLVRVCDIEAMLANLAGDEDGND